MKQLSTLFEERGEAYTNASARVSLASKTSTYLILNLDYLFVFSSYISASSLVSLYKLVCLCDGTDEYMSPLCRYCSQTERHRCMQSHARCNCNRGSISISISLSLSLSILSLYNLLFSKLVEFILNLIILVGRCLNKLRRC